MIRKITSPETHPMTWRIRHDNKPVFIKEYLQKNGYSGVKKAIQNMSSQNIIELIKQSGLQGRGGAGFSTGLKWDLMPKKKDNEKSYARYFLCNADEMEPGTYKDKFLMEKNPHQLIEGIIIGAFALQTSISYIFLRGEYIEAEKILKKSILEAYKNGFLGKNIFDSNFNLDIFLHTGAGRYICGEETALINSLEGKRANPRSKPPYPAYSGLWGKPTCVNNVETIFNISEIIINGAEWYKKLSKGLDAGTKMIGFSGKVKSPGVWEVPFGITGREILEDYALGMINGFTLKAWIPGGASTNILTEKHLDIPMDYTSFYKIGKRLGTAVSTVIDNTINIVSLMYNIEKFFSRESCGLCTPCRDGLPWIVEILNDLKNSNGHLNDINVLKELCIHLGPGKTFCAHAPGAIEPLISAIKIFKKEFKSGIKS